MTEKPRRRGPVQAPVQPVDEDGVVAAITGTAAFAVAAVVLAMYREQLAASGSSWWFLVAVTGVVIGLVTVWYTHWRKRDRTGRRAPAVAQQVADREASDEQLAPGPVERA